jgi:hypothetical protein
MPGGLVVLLLLFAKTVNMAWNGTKQHQENLIFSTPQ